MNQFAKTLSVCILLSLSAVASPAQCIGKWQEAERFSYAPKELSAIFFIHFFDKEYGVVAGESGFIRYTTNGGITWSEATVLGPRKVALQFKEDIFAGTRGGDTLFLISARHLLSSDDRGKTWQIVSKAPTPKSLGIKTASGSRMEFSDIFFRGKEGWALCGIFDGKGNIIQSYVLHKKDSGKPWKLYSTLPTRKLMVNMHFDDSENGWIVGYDGTILNTIDGGHHWDAQIYEELTNNKPKKVRPALLDVKLRGKKGIIIGTQSTIIHSSDGGETWQEVQSPRLGPKASDSNFIRLYFADSNYAWIVTSSGDILCLDNSGTWKRQESGVKNKLFSIFMHDRKHGWVGADRRLLLRYDADDD